jgi:hypothetical protein
MTQDCDSYYVPYRYWRRRPYWNRPFYRPWRRW